MSTSSFASGTSEGPPTSNSRDARYNLSFDKCRGCRSTFDFIKRVNVSKVPLILPCKHSACEDCIRRMCIMGGTECPTCSEEFTVTRAQFEQLTEVFQPHYTIIGRLVWAKNHPVKRDMNLVSTGLTLNNRHAASGEAADLDIDANSDDGREKDVDVTASLIFEKCKEHNDQFLNISCDECGSNYCCYCFLENHVGHKATYLYKVSDTEKAELGNLKVDMEVILSQLLRSKKKVRELKIFEPTDVDQDIKNYFAILHARLHVAEHNIRKRLTLMESQEADISAVNGMLTSGIRRVKNIAKHFKMLNSNELNVRALLEEAKELKDLPCRLVSDQGLLRPIEFVSNSIFDDIEDSISVKSLPSLEYNLLPIEDWAEATETFEIEQTKRQSDTAAARVERIISTPGSSKWSKHSENQVKKSTEGKVRVVVTHINNMDSFFVQKYNSLECLKEMNHFINRMKKKKDRVEEIRVGRIYGVAYETRNSVHWRRGRLLDCQSNGNKTVYKMFFIDYGNTQTVTREKLKEIDFYTTKRPPFAYQCKLVNPNDGIFDEYAHLRLPQILGHKEVFVYGLTLNDHVTIQPVELLVAASNGGMISVRDLLLKTPTSTIETKEALLTTQFKLFRNSKQFVVGQELNVLVVYVENPHHLCVQSVENVQLLEKMKHEMETYYKDQPPLNSIPVVDTDVIVKYEDDIQGNWHRAVITSVEVATKEVDVLFVDWGKNAIVSWSSLRLLTEQFIRIECQGIIVRLADVRNMNSDEPWRGEAINFLRQQINKNKECRMVVSRVDPLQVALFQEGPSVDLCVNSLMVEKGYALSSGAISQTTFWPNVTDPPVEDDNDFSYKILKQSEEVIMAGGEDPHLKTGLRMQVTICSFKNPEDLQVKFVKFQDKEDEMQKELNIHYSAKTSKTKPVWDLKEKCVVFDKLRKSYYRGVIQSAGLNDNYTVYLYDHVREFKVNKNFIYVHDSYFNKFGTFVYKCKLSGIKPAGDAGTWSQLAIELLQKIFAMHKTIYVKKLESNVEEKKFGVIMWYCVTTPAKALEPSVVRYVSINKSLIESGAAFSTLPPKKEARAVKIEEKQDWYDLICEDENNATVDNGTVEDESGDEIEYQATYQNGWPPSLRIQKKEFSAVLMCVDNDGHFYIRDEKINSCYGELEESLSAKFSTLPRIVEETKWEENDMCTIFFDGKWYRGNVLHHENEDQVCVEMIDFGSTHVVPKTDITHRLMFTDIPPFVYKVQLYDVHSKLATWSGDDVNRVLEIVTDNVNIVIKSSLTVDVPHAEIYLDNGSSLNNLIVQKCPHMVRYETKVEFEKDEDEAIDQEGATVDSDSLIFDFTYDCLPLSTHERKRLFVVSILKWDSAFNVVLSSQEDVAALAEFVALSDELQELAEGQPALEKVELDAPCVCLQPQKRIWSRAVVYGTGSLAFGFVLAFFVDYGTVEMVPVASLREMRNEWFKLPVYMQIAGIDIELLRANKSESVLTQLNDLRGKPAFVEIVTEEPLKVHLYNEDGVLCYEHFVVVGVIQAL